MPVTASPGDVEPVELWPIATKSTVRMVFLDGTGATLSASEAAPCPSRPGPPAANRRPFQQVPAPFAWRWSFLRFYYSWLSYAYFDDLTLTLGAGGTAATSPSSLLQTGCHSCLDNRLDHDPARSNTPTTYPASGSRVSRTATTAPRPMMSSARISLYLLV